MAKGKLSISCWSSNQVPHQGFTISVVDETSGVTFLEVEVTPENFALALASRVDKECDFELRGLECVGKTREVKTENVFIPKHAFRERDIAADLAVAKFEVDWWQGRRSDVGNTHRRVSIGNGGETYSVSFTRFVP